MATTLKEAVIENSIVDGECRVWTGSFTTRGRPIAKYKVDDNLMIIDVQRYLAVKKFNIPVGKRLSIRTSCGNPHCITAAHIEVQKETRTRSKPVIRYDAISCDVELNKQVFDLAVNHKKQDILVKTGLNYYKLSTVLGNKIMLPYFQIKLAAYLGAELLETVRNSKLTKRVIQAKYKLSAFAVDFIKSGLRFNIQDEEAFIALLSQCFVMGDHLVWNGEVVNGTPVAQLGGGALKNASKLFVYSVTGELPEHELQCNCGHKDCINPWHLE